jgi:hypothetical protein
MLIKILTIQHAKGILNRDIKKSFTNIKMLLQLPPSTANLDIVNNMI